MSDVQPGYIYRDKDPRMGGRHLKVLEVDARFAQCVGCAPDGRVTGKRSRVSLSGLAQRFEKVGGSTQGEDLERAALEALVAWREADRAMLQARERPLGDDPAATMEAECSAEEREAEAFNALRAAADSLSAAKGEGE